MLTNGVPRRTEAVSGLLRGQRIEHRAQKTREYPGTKRKRPHREGVRCGRQEVSQQEKSVTSVTPLGLWRASLCFFKQANAVPEGLVGFA